MQTSNIQRIDAGGSQVIETGGGILTAIPDYISSCIKALQHLPGEHEQFTNNTPDLLDIAKRIIRAFAQYHATILRASSNWSEKVREMFEQTTRWFFYPISFCKIGRAIANVITERVVGNTAQAVSFVCFQIFHLLPYVVASAFTTGVIFLYYQAPVALISCLAGSLLLIQVYFIIRLVKEIEVSNKILETNLKNLEVFSYFSWAALKIERGLRWAASWLPGDQNNGPTKVVVPEKGPTK